MKNIQTIKILLLTLIILSVLTYFTPIKRYLQTLFLILQTSPYERVAEGVLEILVIGDSTGYGTGVRYNTNSIAGLIGQNYPWYTIRNNSVNGRTIGESVAEAKKISGDYSLILLQLGANDILQERDISIVENDLRELIVLLEDNTDNLVMISSGNVGGSPYLSEAEAKKYTELSREFRTMFNRVGSETALTYVDLFVEPADDPMLNESDKYIAKDGLHPNAAGYALWYKKLSPVIDEVLHTK